MNFYDPLKNILKRGAESEKYKYSLIISAVTMVHICLVAFFGVCRIYLMMFLNMGSVGVTQYDGITYCYMFVGIPNSVNFYA